MWGDKAEITWPSSIGTRIEGSYVGISCANSVVVFLDSLNKIGSIASAFIGEIPVFLKAAIIVLGFNAFNLALW